MATTYLSPGVYVEEVPSGSAPIAGVGTSTAGFIGVITLGKIEENGEKRYLIAVKDEKVGTGDGVKKEFKLSLYPVWERDESIVVKVGVNTVAKETYNLINNDTKKESLLKFNDGNAPDAGYDIVVNYQFKSVPKDEVKLCTNFREFAQWFGNFTGNVTQNTLAHGVYGFFNNGGTRCYVVWTENNSMISTTLRQFEPIDEIAIVAGPGITAASAQEEIKLHCEKMTDRFAILDSPLEADPSSTDAAALMPFESNYAALYYPWIKVFDPASNNPIFVPPSGHMAGIYARVDTQRGVHKAPANEQILGALDLKYKISKAHQEGLNPKGINCIRNLNGNILVWGARTLGGDANGEWKYINVRRLFLYLRESIEESTQWIVFEPNSPELWAKIRRNVTAFLTNVWRSGALFGTTPEQAFFVKCDEETNPPEVRDQGKVVTEIGVAVVKPAEFAIFRISQWTGASGS